MQSETIAVLFTCYNRRDKTLQALEAAFEQVLPKGVELVVYLVDDGSSDGTSEAVSQNYPQVKIFRGDGSLFWNGGMRMAFGEALKSDFDYYLWLNDDTTLDADALAKLFSTYHHLSDRSTEPIVVVGATCDPDTRVLTYSGMVRSTWWHPLKFRLAEPGEDAKLCDTMNGNCVLIPRAIAQLVGNLDPNFTHSTGDLDYGLRVKQHGGSVWLASGYVGTCRVNSFQGDSWEAADLSWRDRFKKALNPKGLPLAEWKVFARRHAGPLWPFYWSLPYLRLLLAAIFGGRMSSHING